MAGNISSFTLLNPYLLTAILILVLLSWIYRGGNTSTSRKLPPGPPAWPLVGYIFDLGTRPHQKFYELRKKYGPVLWIKLGLIDTMVIQSAKAAAQLFKNHDLAFSDRKVPDALTAWDYNQGSLAMGNYGPYWRMLRKLCSMELLVNKRVKESTEIREKCVEKMVQWIEENEASSHAQGRSGEIVLVQSLYVMSFNVVGNLMLSRDLLDINSTDGREFFNAMNKIMKWAGEPNIADFLPYLKWLDPAKVKRNMVRDLGIAINIVTSFLKDRSLETMPIEKVNKDFLDMLLHYKSGKEGPEKISEKNIIIIILEMFFAGSETTSSTIEWAMAELLRNPESMKKVKEELDSIPVTSKSIKESDIDKLPYLRAVVKETLRLHPPVPLLLPRNAMEDTNFMGYLIPKSTQVYVNVWAIGRDPDVWEDPLSFKPDRFVGSNIDYKGQHFELIPFGSGRRICVGMTLGERVIHLSLANLLWTFDWELGNSITPANLDMTERTGLTLRMMNPLKAIPKKRSNFINMKH